jgi:hypothetical protein
VVAAVVRHEGDLVPVTAEFRRTPPTQRSVLTNRIEGLETAVETVNGISPSHAMGLGDGAVWITPGDDGRATPR